MAGATSAARLRLVSTLLRKTPWRGHSLKLGNLGVGAPLAACAAAGLGGLVLAVRPEAQSSRLALCEADPAAAPGRPTLVEAIPADVKLASSTVRLYQYESCPFCRKVRSCLDYHKVPYEIVEVHPLNKNETKEVAPDYKKVPILRIDTADGRQFQLRDSKTIVAALLKTFRGASSDAEDKRVVPAPSQCPSTAKMWPGDIGLDGVSPQAQWIQWTDAVLVKCVVLNVYRTMSESAETFRYLLTHPEFSWYAQRSAAFVGTVMMWGVAKVRRRQSGVEDERGALYEALECFAAAVRSGGAPFLGGSRPGAADFNVYGVLRSTESFQTERDWLENCQGILPWYRAMESAVGPSSATNFGCVKRG